MLNRHILKASARAVLVVNCRNLVWGFQHHTVVPKIDYCRWPSFRLVRYAYVKKNSAQLPTTIILLSLLMAFKKVLSVENLFTARNGTGKFRWLVTQLMPSGIHFSKDVIDSNSFIRQTSNALPL